MNSLDGLPEPATGASASKVASTFKLLQMAGLEAGDGLQFECAGERLSVLSLQLEPGQTNSLILVSEFGLSLSQVRAAHSAAGLESGAWQLSLEPLGFDENGVVGPRVDTALLDPAIQLIRLSVSASTSVQPGQSQELSLFGSGESEHSGGLTIQLNARDETPMFRDHFQVEPTVGQFSMRRRSQPSIEAQPSPAAGGASL